MSSSSLSFAEIVASEFGPIGSNFGFREVRRNDRNVRFESERTYVIFIHTRFDEVELSFGQLADEVAGHTGFGLFDLLHAVDADLARASRARTAGSCMEMMEAIHEIVVVLNNIGQRVLAGDQEAYESLARQRIESQQAYQDEAKASRIRPQAEKAFKDQDFEKAARLYRSIDDRLSVVERQKLALAERKGREARMDKDEAH